MKKSSFLLGMALTLSVGAIGYLYTKGKKEKEKQDTNELTGEKDAKFIKIG